MSDQELELTWDVQVWGKSIKDMAQGVNIVASRGFLKECEGQQVKIVAHTKRLAHMVQVKHMSEELRHLLLTESDCTDLEGFPIIVQASVKFGPRSGEGAAAVFVDLERNSCMMVLCFEVTAR